MRLALQLKQLDGPVMLNTQAETALPPVLLGQFMTLLISLAIYFWMMNFERQAF